MQLNPHALEAAYAAAPADKRDKSLIASVIRAYVDAETNPHHSDADGEDFSRDFEEHDCGEDTCVCADQ